MEAAYCRIRETEEGEALIEVTGAGSRWTKLFADFDSAIRTANILKLIPAGMAQIASRPPPGRGREIRNALPQGCNLDDVAAAGFLVERVPPNP